MMRNKFLFWIPEPIRTEKLQTLKGQPAIRFPAAYFIRAPYHLSPLWQNLMAMDDTGFVVKTGPDFLIQGLVDYLTQNNIPYELFTVGEFEQALFSNFENKAEDRTNDRQTKTT